MTEKRHLAGMAFKQEAFCTCKGGSRAALQKGAGAVGRSAHVSEPARGPIPKERMVHWQHLFLLLSLLVSLFTGG